MVKNEKEKKQENIYLFEMFVCLDEILYIYVIKLVFFLFNFFVSGFVVITDAQGQSVRGICVCVCVWGGSIHVCFQFGGRANIELRDDLAFWQ